MIRWFLALVLAGSLASCSSGFRSDWRAAAKAGPQPGAVGAWQGTWKSDVNGHHGRLRCVVSPALNAQGDHSFHYHATWAGLLSGAYRAVHRVTPEKAGARFAGTHRMPDWAGGQYTYAGRVTGDRFQACYECAKDKGTFEMTRVR